MKKPGRGDVLLVVDVQNAFMPGGALGVRRGDEIIAPINRLIDRWSTAGLPVYLTRDWHPADHCSFHAQGGPWPEHCVAGTPGARFAPALHVPERVDLVSKATQRSPPARSASSTFPSASRPWKPSSSTWSAAACLKWSAAPKMGKNSLEWGMMEAAFSSETRVNKSSGWQLFLKTVYARAYPRLIGQQREKSWLFFDVFLPLMAVSAYVFVYRTIGAPEEYVGFVVIGGAMTAFWLNVLWSMSSQLYWEKEQGNLALYIMAPNSMVAILLGMALGGLLASILRALVITLFGSWVFQVSYEIASYGLLFLVFTLTMVALYGMGMMMASLFLLLGREAWHLASLAQEPIYLVSGFYFPLRSLIFWIALSRAPGARRTLRKTSRQSGSHVGTEEISPEIPF